MKLTKSIKEGSGPKKMMFVEISDSAGENQDGQVMEISDEEADSEPKIVPPDVSEFFSRPRAVPRCHLFGLVPGRSFDMLNDDIADLLSLEGRAMVYSHLEEDQPLVSILSPPCKMFSLLMKSNKSRMDPAVYAARRVDGEHLLSFAVNVAQHRRRRRRYFLLEHPDGADSWMQADLRDLMSEPDVLQSRFDQCVYGLKAPFTGDPIKKRTRFLHNIPEIHDLFGDQFCRCTVPHQQIQGSLHGVQLSSYCETYPVPMVDTMLAAIQRLRGRVAPL